jgi:hypothetical protein
VIAPLLTAALAAGIAVPSPFQLGRSHDGRPIVAVGVGDPVRAGNSDSGFRVVLD